MGGSHQEGSDDSAGPDEHKPVGGAGKAPLCVLLLVEDFGANESGRAALDIIEAVNALGGRSVLAYGEGRLALRAHKFGAETAQMTITEATGWRAWRNRRALRKLVRREAVDVVHVLDIGAARFAHRALKRARKPMIFNCNAPLEGSRRNRNRLYRIFEAAEMVIAGSEPVRQELIKRRPSLKKRVVAIMRGVDHRVYSEEAVNMERVARLAEKWRLDDDSRPVFLMPATLAPGENVELFIEAAAKLRALRGDDFLALITGDTHLYPDYVAMLEKRLRKRKSNGAAHLVGPCADMAAAYLFSSCVVAAPGAQGEAARAPLEAQAMGKPVIAPHIEKSREAISPHEEGWSVRPNDPAALAAAMQAFLEISPEECARMGAAGVAQSRIHNAAAISSGRILQIYQDCAASR